MFFNKGKTVEILANYEPHMVSFGEWYKQLFAESEGKDSHWYYKRRFSNSSFLSSNPGLPRSANIFFLYASTPGWSNGLMPIR